MPSSHWGRERRRGSIAAVGAVCAAAMFAAALRAPAGESTPAVRPPEKAAAIASKPEPADNSYCNVCHANYEGEKLTAVHQPVGVGCEKCHGESVKHSGDEDGLTPPDKMFGKAEISPFCITCHEKSKLLARDDHKEFFKSAEPDETCNDCHGQKHRMAVRTRIWDKKTGKLLKDDGVRMMQKDSPATEGAAAPKKK